MSNISKLGQVFGNTRIVSCYLGSLVQKGMHSQMLINSHRSIDVFHYIVQELVFYLLSRLSKEYV